MFIKFVSLTIIIILCSFISVVFEYIKDFFSNNLFFQLYEMYTLCFKIYYTSYKFVLPLTSDK